MVDGVREIMVDGGKGISATEVLVDSGAISVTGPKKEYFSYRKLQLGVKITAPILPLQQRGICPNAESKQSLQSV